MRHTFAHIIWPAARAIGTGKGWNLRLDWSDEVQPSFEKRLAVLSPHLYDNENGSDTIPPGLTLCI